MLLNGFQNMTYLEYDSECKLYLERNISVQRKEMPEAANADKLSELELENAYDEQRENATQSDELPLPSNSQLAQVESCQILGINSVGVRLSHSLEILAAEHQLHCKKSKRQQVVHQPRRNSKLEENNYPDCDAKEKFEQSGGWIKALPEEAENERMHLMTMVELVQPKWYERVVGHLEEEAIH
ncbi:Ubiquinol oxidase 2, mitochondrial [Capsicum chinense]|nr:Ubiquinol oxidase 2, mitochondrial [Capsicum chinense]